jgi:hypothetical protein
MVEMPKYQVHCKPFYDTMWWQRYAAHICNLLVPNQLIYVDTSNWIPDDPPLDDPLHLPGAHAAQLSQPLGSLLDPDMAILSAHSAAASGQWSSRP